MFSGSHYFRVVTFENLYFLIFLDSNDFHYFPDKSFKHFNIFYPAFLGVISQEVLHNIYSLICGKWKFGSILTYSNLQGFYCKVS